MTVVQKSRKTKEIYLAGPMSGCTHEDMHGWRERIKNHSDLHEHTLEKTVFSSVIAMPLFHYLDPSDRFYDEIAEMDLKVCREIVMGDKADISSADIVLANLSQLGKYSCVGTLMEVIYAYGLGKYVVTITNPDRPLSPWIVYHSTRIVHSEQAAVDVVRRSST